MMARSPASLGQELSQLREGMENAYYRQRTVEQRLRTVLRQAGRSAIRIEVFDVVGANQREPSVPAGHAAAPASGAWPRARKNGRILRPTPGLANLTMTDSKIAVVGVSVCGFEAEQLDQIVTMIAEKQLADLDFVPVFLTDSLHAEIFRKHRYAFEYLPMTPADRKLPGTRPWAEYAGRRLAMIQQKYGIERILAFGNVPFGKG
jgi:hypothetical protein